MVRSEPAGHDADEERGHTGGRPRLVASWLVVGVPLAYGVVETVRAILPLFGH